MSWTRPQTSLVYKCSTAVAVDVLAPFRRTRYLHVTFYTPLRHRFASFMPERSAAADPCQPALKRRRLSTMTAAEEPAQSLPQLELTPREALLKRLMLDVREYILQKQKNEGKTEQKGEDLVLRFTGGWVRDKLLGINGHDIDIGISTMTGYQFGMELKEYLDVPENLEKYKDKSGNGELNDVVGSLHKIEANPEKSKHLETVATRIFGMDVDLVNLRKETYTEDSRNPQMEFGTAEEDALRRDATVNALFYNLNESKLEDLTGMGLRDMRDKIIRTPLEPYQTFKDDPLRVLRLIRFASRLGYRIEEETKQAMRDEDISKALKIKISKERIGTEVDKMLKGMIPLYQRLLYLVLNAAGPDPREGLRLIDELALFPTIFANLRDDATADTSTWSRAYGTLARIIKPAEDDELAPAAEIIRRVLLRDATDTHHAWVIAAFAPWATVPPRGRTRQDKQPVPPRTAEIARDALRYDNRTVGFLKEATIKFRYAIELKESVLTKSIPGTSREVRRHVGMSLRRYKEWRVCVVMAMLQEAMGGAEPSKGELIYWNVYETLKLRVLF